MKKLLIAFLFPLMAFGQGTPTLRFNTVADMVARPIPTVNNSLTAFVTGRVTANDGGGGTFFFTPASVTATNLGTVFPSTGVAGRWFRDYEDGDMNVKWFGAIGDGIANEVTSLQNAIDSAVNNQCLFFPTGIYRINSVLSTIGGIRFQGETRDGVFLRLGSSTQNGISHQSGAPLVISDMQIDTVAAAQTSGAFIIIEGSTPGVTENYYSQFINVWFSNHWIGIDFRDASLFTVDRCVFNNVQSISVKVDNRINSDSGDGQIINSIFSIGSYTPPVTAIYQVASSGLHVVNSKFFAHTTGYHLNPRTGSNSGQLWLLGNSFEASTVADVKMERTTGTGVWGGGVISANFFSGVEQTNVCILTTNASWLAGFTITGNQFTLGTASTAINIAGGDDIFISANQIKASAGTTVGINLGAAPSGIRVGANSFISVSTPTIFTGTPADLKFVGNNYSFGINANLGLTEFLTLPNNKYLSSLNAAGSGFIRAIGINATNQVDIADASTPTRILGSLQVNGDAAVAAGNLVLITAGNGLTVKEGSNARMGASVLNGGSPASVVVANTSVTANTRIFLTGNLDGGTVGFVRVSARTASTSFTITSSANGDTSTVAWLLVEPSP